VKFVVKGKVKTIIMLWITIRVYVEVWFIHHFRAVGSSSGVGRLLESELWRS